MTGKYSRQQATLFEWAMRAHVEDKMTLVIPGTYRGEPGVPSDCRAMVHGVS